MASTFTVNSSREAFYWHGSRVLITGDHPSSDMAWVVPEDAPWACTMAARREDLKPI